MAYAKLRLKPKDCSFIQDILTRRVVNVVKKQDAASSDKERDFYGNTLKQYAELQSKITASGGKLSLTEQQLGTLRGALFGGEKPDVAKAYAAARQSGDDALASVYAAQLAELERLDDILSRPLVNDRSQDAEDEDEDEQEDDGEDSREQS